MYGLESTIMNQSTLKRLDAFRMKELRMILQLKPTYYDRDNSNKRVLELAARKLGAGGEMALETLSEFHKSKRKWMMAKLLTLRQWDPRAKTAFDVTTLKPHDNGKKRVGRPRLNWVTCPLADFWEEAKEEHTDIRYLGSLDLEDPIHREHMSDALNPLYMSVTMGIDFRTVWFGFIKF